MTDNKNSGFFITGTDTDVGKTYVSRRLAQAFSVDTPVTYCKPVQTGCPAREDGSLRAPDFEYVKSSGICRLSAGRQHAPYCFAPACAPHLAAQLSGVTISFSYIKECLNAVGKDVAVTIVEGAGGLFVPLGRGRFMIDLIGELGLPVILVTTPRLGTLNHTLLSIEMLRIRGFALAGVVMNNAHNLPQDYIYRDNCDFIAKAVKPVPFLTLDYDRHDEKGLPRFVHELRKNHP